MKIIPKHPFFSICIPVYKNVSFLKRLLDSVFVQVFEDFEVVISDDSPDSSVKDFLAQSYSDHRICYFKNDLALGTPENWNEAIRKAKGQWIKLMHDDDWFSTNKSLETLYEVVQKSNSDFYFFAYNNVYLDEGNRVEVVHCPNFRWRRVLKFPPNLYSKNIIGPPSAILIKNHGIEYYDNRLKWLVDIDYYIRQMKFTKPVYIDTPLINVGLSHLQVTTYTHNKPEVEIPEGLLLLSKVGFNAFHHILFFDAWWRLIRNISIRRLDDFVKYSEGYQMPHQIKRIINVQRIFSPKLLRFGPFSKALMFLTWAACRLMNQNKA